MDESFLAVRSAATVGDAMHRWCVRLGQTREEVEMAKKAKKGKKKGKK